MEMEMEQPQKHDGTPGDDESSFSSEDDADSMLEDSNSVGHAPLTVRQRKSRELAARSTQVRCKYCYPTVVLLNNLRDHVKRIHPKFYDAKKHRLEYMAPLEQKEPLEPKFRQKVQESDDDLSYLGSQPNKRPKLGPDEGRVDSLDLQKDLAEAAQAFS